MLQWKFRFVVLILLAVVAVAAFGGLADAGQSVLQFGW